MFVSVTIIFIIALIPIMLLSKSEVKILVSQDTRVEITFTLFSLELSDFGGKGDKKSPFSEKRRIFSRLLSLIEKSDITVKKLRLSRAGGDGFSPLGYTLPYGYHVAISALVAYIRGKAQRLNIDDNAIILIPDGNEPFSLTLLLRARLFYVLTCALGIYRDTKKSEKKRRKENYVGN
ncbi:MAG: hypothetical protein J6Q85_05140 [Clostridia bacterium]|nr:hypothetical protein [Clostridia bacterium]